MKFFIIGLLVLFMGVNNLNAALRTASVSGNWDNTATWGGVVKPTSADDVVINSGITVTVNVAAICNSLTFVAGTGGTVTVNSGITLAVTNALTLNNAANASVTAFIDGTGTLNCASINVGNNKNPTSLINTHTLTASLSNMSVTGDLTIKSERGNKDDELSNGVFVQTSGNLTVNGSIKTVNENTVNISSFTLGSTTPTLILGGTTPFTISGSGTSIITLNGTGATVNYAKLTGTQTVRAGTYNNLTINTIGGVTLSGAVSISGVLTLTNGIVTTSNSNLLTLTNTATTAISGGSTTAFVNGPLLRSLPASLVLGSTYNFPVGKVSTYLPFSLVNPTTGTGTVTAWVEAFNSDAGGTIDATLNSKSNTEYWSFTPTGNFTNSSVSATRQAAISPNDVIAGSTSVAGQYTTLAGTVVGNGVTGSNAISTNRAFVLAKKNTIVVSPSCLTGFNYIVGFGPSAQKSFTVSGSSLIANIIVTPSTNYEISTTSGSGFQSTPITLTQSGGIVAPTTVYVRLKTGLTAGNYNSENIACTSTSAETKNVVCNGTVNTPTITTSVATLIGFTYPEGYGPSAEKWFTVSGTNLVDNIKVYPSAKFEISTGTGAAFVPTSIITLPVSGGTVNSTTIYVRMKTGLLGIINPEDIASESTGATTKNVACSGTVVTAPLIVASPISGTFTYIFGSGPSASRTFTVSGTKLGGSVVITPPTNYEISSNGGTNYFSTPITLGLSSGNPVLYTGVLNATTITVRLKIALGTGSYSENVVVTSTNATLNVALTGVVDPKATIYNPISFLSGFIYSGAGPSGIQSFVVKATALTADVIATPPTNFEISKDGINFQLTAITLYRVGTVLTTDTLVYVRLKSGLAVGDYGPSSSSVVLTSTGAIAKSVACKGKVVNVKTLLVSKDSLTGFGYQLSAVGPSTPQSFTVSGAMLGGGAIDLLAPTNYEISKSFSSGYVTTISLTGTTVNPTLIYVRLKSGLPVASYGTKALPVNLTVTTTGVSTINVSCIGKVFASNLITSNGGGSYCIGNTINLSSTGADVINQYWTGPNSYYSTLQNPVLTTNASTNLSGTYTVNGNVVVGGNLITNGDFEAGNTSFSSVYGYVAPVAGALGPEGNYTIVNQASAVHGDFTNQPDHTLGAGSLQMVVNGSPIAGVVVWTQSVPVIPGANYQFVYSEQTVNIPQNPKNASQLQLYVNGVAAGPIYTAPQVNYVWDTFLYNVAAGTNTVLNLELINQNTVASGNDFALDDLIFQQILPATSSQIVNVNPTVVPSVNLTYAPSNVYQNVPVVFTANTINGGVTPAYKWFVGGVEVVGQTSSTFSYTPTSTGLLNIRCEMTSSIACALPKPATTTASVTVQAPLANYWMGSSDTNWGKPENWTAGYVPATGDNVVFATVANFGTSAMRDLQLDQNRTIGSLINATTQRLIIPAAKGLTVNNTINITNKVNEADRIYIYSSSTLPNGSLSFKNLSSNPVAATVEMYSKASFDTKQAVNNKFNWQYFGIPLQSVVPNPTLSSGLDSTYVRQWFETGTTIHNNYWIQVTNETVLQPFYGYEICQKNPRTYYFKGQLVNSDFNSGQLAITPSAKYPGQYIFANPYTAAIDIRQLTFGTGTQATVYLYNTGTYSSWLTDGGFNSGTGAGQYVAIPYNAAGISTLPRQVPSMQAMLIKAQSLSSNAYFGINYNAVIMNNAELQRLKDEDNESDKVSTRIDVKGKYFSDKMWIFTEPGCSSNFDNGWDGYKFLGSSVSPQIFAKESDGDYQVTTVGDMNNSNIYFQAGEDTEYTLTFTHNNLKKKYQGVYLVDLVENRTVEITETGTEYKFSSVSTPKALNRFTIVTRPYDENPDDSNSLVKVFSAGKTVLIHNFSSVDGELTLYDISGRILKKGTFTANGVTAINTNYISGGYIVRANTSLEEISKRIILR